MSIELKPWGGVDPLFPFSGEVYVSSNGFYLNDVHGGPKSVAWLDGYFEAREDDVYVVSFPKTGTTWCQEIVYLIGNDLNFEKSRSGSLFERFPYLELLFTVENSLVHHLPLPRFIKSHYPYSLLPKSIIDKKCKIIYPIRNPRDTLVSFYHFVVSHPSYKFTEDFKTLFDLFINNERLIYSPYWKHIREFWEHRHEENILIVHYEDLKKHLDEAQKTSLKANIQETRLHKDPHTEVKRIANFLGKTLTDHQIDQVVDYCSFDKMKSSSRTDLVEYMSKDDFLRKGEVGDWKNLFTEEMQKQMDDYVEKYFKGSGLEFKYTI